MGVSAVVVTYNRLNLLKECLSNLLKQTYKLDKIFVINNNSTDGTEDYLSNLNNNKVIAINLDKNLGGAGGFSLGTKMAFERSHSKYFWIMDDDTMPTKDALKNLMQKAYLLKNNFGFLCSNVRWWKNYAPCNIPSVSNNWTNLINKSLVGVKTATFVSVLFSRDKVAKLGLPISDMFIWGDDTEYTTRLSTKYNCYFVPSSIVLHKSATNKSYETIFNASMNRVKFYKCMYRNLIYIDRTYYSKEREIKDFIKFFVDAIKVPFKSKDHKMKRMSIITESILRGLTFRPKVKFPKED